jgi:hypothetical protein
MTNVEEERLAKAKVPRRILPWRVGVAFFMEALDAHQHRGLPFLFPLL